MITLPISLACTVVNLTMFTSISCLLSISGDLFSAASLAQTGTHHMLIHFIPRVVINKFKIYTCSKTAEQHRTLHTMETLIFIRGVGRTFEVVRLW